MKGAPGHDSGLAGTDPEFVGYFDSFAFGEVIARDDIDPRVGFVTRVGALIAVGAVAELRDAIDAALRAGVTPVEIKEVVYQAVPYVGVGRARDALHAINDLLVERGVELPLPGQSTTTPETRAAKGRAVQEQIVGADRVAAMYANAPSDELHIQRYLSENCFGDHYTRNGLDVTTRELLTLAMLVALGGADAQVRGHVAANLRVGNDRATLIAVVTQLLPYIGYPRALNAFGAIDEVAPGPTSAPAPHDTPQGEDHDRVES
jgi:4-carboxymuconolactone decarboxylase